MKAKEITKSKKRWKPEFYIVAHEVSGFEGVFLSREGALGRVGDLLENEIHDVAQFDKDRAAGIKRLLSQGGVVQAYELFMVDPIGHTIEIAEFTIGVDLRPGMKLYMVEHHRLDWVPVYVGWSTKEERDGELLAMQKRLAASGGDDDEDDDEVEEISAIDAEIHP